MEETKDINETAAEETKTAEKKKKTSKQSEIDALKASIAEIRREMRNMHGEIVRELSAKFA